jgi:SAM-dependent methyltransferase
MNDAHPFLNPKPAPDRLFDYRLRRDIRDALTAQLPNFCGTLLDVGCGQMPYRSLLTSPPSRVVRYVGLDIEGSLHGRPDLEFDGHHIPLEDHSMDTVLATEVLEHCPEPGQLLVEIRRVLKPGGLFFFTVPFFWPLHEVPFDFFRYTPYAMQHLLEQAGFSEIQIRAHAGWDASLAQMLGLWLNYRGMRPWKRRALSRLFQPLVILLNRLDEPPAAPGESIMLTGLSGTARTPAPQSR